MRQHEAMSVPSIHQLLDQGGALLPVRGARHPSAGVAIHPKPHALVQKPQQIAEIGVVVIMTDVDAMQRRAFFFEHADLLFPHAVRRPGVGRDGNACPMMRAGRGA